MYEDKDIGYVNSRLDGTMIDHDGMLYYFVATMGDKVVLKHIKSGNMLELLPSELKLNPVRLGYVPRTSCTYLVRVPKRRDWRQGVRKNSVASYIRGMRTHVGGELVTMLKNIYHRSFEKPEVVIEKGSGTLSRDFAVARGNLFYKRFVCGVVEGNEIILFDNFKWLKETFDEQVG